MSSPGARPGLIGNVHLDIIAVRLYSYLAMQDEARLTEMFSALADPTRRAILARLAKGEATVSELAEPFGLRQPTISKHLRILEDAGFIRQARDAQRRPRNLVVGGPLKDLDAWLKPFREQWERRFDALESFLDKKKRANKGDK
jgi:DNA-binding transcriptional ArsR family regulator